jgi:Zn-finger protein
MRKVEFISDFATKKKGDVWECDSLLASHLVHTDKVAKYVDEEVKPKVKK